MRIRTVAGAVVLLGGLAVGSVSAQQLTSFERKRALDMLDVVRQDINRNYFDTLYAGVDLAAVFDTAETRIKSAAMLEQVLGVIAAATASFNDSHTMFVPPGLVYRAEYGWELRFVGDTCRLVRVEPGSDADAKGLRMGDVVSTVQGIPVTRTNIWQLEYLLEALRPSASVRMEVRGAAGAVRQLDVGARVVERHNIMDIANSTDFWDLLRSESKSAEESAVRWREVNGGAIVIRVPSFRPDNDWVDAVAKAIRGSQSVVIDLRGNRGGSVRQLSRFLGLFYEDDISAARVVERRKVTELKAEGTGPRRYAGKVVVLIDAASASASELFSRTVQLTGRGTVVGDRSAGAVRVSRLYVHASGTQTAAFYGTSVTVGDVIMPDGAGLERIGVTPDEVVLPSGEQMSRNADPVLARALGLVGVSMTPEQAGLYRP